MLFLALGHVNIFILRLFTFSRPVSIIAWNTLTFAYNDECSNLKFLIEIRQYLIDSNASVF